MVITEKVWNEAVMKKLEVISWDMPGANRETAKNMRITSLKTDILTRDFSNTTLEFHPFNCDVRFMI
jgi:hypothetical protein